MDDLLQLLRNRTDDLTLRLVSSPVTLPFEPSSVTECNFPGYQPARRLPWSIATAQQSGDELWMTTGAAFTRTAAGSPQQAAGCLVAFAIPGGGYSVVTFKNFRAPLSFDAAGDSVILQVCLQGFEVAAAPERQFVMALTEHVLNWKGGGQLFALTGQDRDTFKTLLGTLEWAMRRDADLADLTNRSTRSKLPLVPAGDAELGAAVTLVRDRLHTLLAQ